jgi:UDP-perosamine 4-acetyltransferase
LKRPVIILGAGGHGRVILDLLQKLNYEVRGFSDPDQTLWGKTIDGVPVIGGDDEILNLDTDVIHLALGVGGTGDNSFRKKLFTFFSERHYTFPSFVHPSAIIASNVILGKGSIAMAGSVIQTGCRIGDNVIINTGALVDHNCIIGDHVHIAPGAVISGNVSVGVGAHLGTGSTVIQNIRIGDRALVAAGAVVVRDIEPGEKVMGVPAKRKG